MKFKKGRDNDMVSLYMRRVFAQGRSMSIKWIYEEVESFTGNYFFGCKPFNRKRDTSNYWKEIYRDDYNDGIFWNGEES